MIGGKSNLDEASSLAAVASKVGEIAASRHADGALHDYPRVAGASGCGTGNGYPLTFGYHGEADGGRAGSAERHAVGLDPNDVTPSPMLQGATVAPPRSTESEALPCAAAPGSSHSGEASSLGTPLPGSPNPARHAMGATRVGSSSPESVIRPKVLTYDRGGWPGGGGGIGAGGCLYGVGRNCAPATSPLVAEGLLQRSRSASNYSPTLKSPASRSVPATPVIQNGTLAAASALMTLFSEEKKMR